MRQSFCAAIVWRQVTTDCYDNRTLITFNLTSYNIEFRLTLIIFFLTEQAALKFLVPLFSNFAVWNLIRKSEEESRTEKVLRPLAPASAILGSAGLTTSLVGSYNR